ncbi:hypothetical protein [Peptoniphilus lacrimalis]|uniref:hypothetical protein n=1 Tax=Peptoniphilus lacrimalis TaxID=33031 RepID=UPI0023F87274|nr:hypothetical protein [Peptoniphilus lacrimalis]
MKNTLGDLNNHIFAELERLGDEGLTGDELKEELTRAESIVRVSSSIISNASLVLQAEKFKDQKMDVDLKTPKMLEG